MILRRDTVEAEHLGQPDKEKILSDERVLMCRSEGAAKSRVSKNIQEGIPESDLKA
jgi:hypothetical protein